MNKYLSMFNIKVGTGIAVAMFVGFVGVLAVAPTQADHTQAESCSPVYTSPIFDPYPVTWANDPGVGCNDFAVISGGVHNVSPNWADNFSANTGDTITLRVYVHNGAATGSGQVMHNTAYNVNLDNSTGSSHTITAQLTASNASEVDGSLTIDTPAGDSLQLVSGSLNSSVTTPGQATGDLLPCFDYSQVFYITLQVVGPAQPTGSNSISATPSGQLGSQCLLGGTVQWTDSSDVQSVDVTVQDLTANSSVNSITGTGGTPNSSSSTNWLTPGDTYQYSLYNTTNGQFTLLQQTNEQVPALNCGSAPTPTPTPVQVSGINNLTATAGLQIGSQCLRTGTVSWTNSSDVQTVNITVEDLTTGSSINSITGSSGFPNSSSATPWLTPGDTYEYWMYNTTNGQQTLLYQTLEAVPALNCAQPTPVPTPTPTPVPTQQSYNLTVYPTTFCSTSIPTFTITNATSGLFGQSIYWSSTFNGQATGENLDYYGNSIDFTGNSSVQAAAGSYTNYIGNWSKTATVYAGPGLTNPVQRTVYFTVQNCAQPTPTPTPQPTPTPVQTQIFTATATATASASASASCPGGTSASATASASASATATSYISQQDAQNQAQSQAQTKANAQAQANAQASASTRCPAPTPTPTPIQSCVANSNFALNVSTPVKQGAGYSVVLTWSSTGNNNIKITEFGPGSNSEQQVTIGNASGSFTVGGLVAGSNYIFKMYDDNCGSFLTSAQITTPANPGQLVCNVGSSAINSGQQASFTVSGGSAPYSWSGDGSPSSGSGSSFNPSYTNSSQTASTHTVDVNSADGQSTSCSVIVNGTTPQSGLVNLTKTVKNITAGDSGFSHSTNAKQNDTLEYQIQVSAGTSVTLQNVNVTDTFASGLTYVQGSMQVNGQSHAAGLTSGGLNFSQVDQNGITITYEATVNVMSGTVVNTAQASASNANNVAKDQATVNISFTPAPTPTPTPVQTGNCNNDSNSCNVNTNNNTQTNTGTNSSNQNSNTNINGNNNTVTTTNENCVNNSCNNIVYINTAGNTVPANQFSQLTITKLVSANGTGFQNSVSVNSGQTVQFQITVTNAGNAVANNVTLTDNLPSGLSLSGNYNFSNGYNNNNNFYGSMNLGNLNPGQQVTVNFSAIVNGNYGSSIQNTATASASNTGNVQASAWVFVNNQIYTPTCTYNCTPVQNNTVNLTYSKSAFNTTKNADAQSVVASREDFITYTLTVQNSGNSPANNFVVTDDLSQVLPYADISDYGGGSLNGNVISFPGITVPANGSVTRSFQVRVKYSLASNLSYVMTNTYGNTVTVRINTPPTIPFTAPTTGADTMGFAFSGALTAAAALFRKRKDLLKMIFS